MRYRLPSTNGGTELTGLEPTLAELELDRFQSKHEPANGQPELAASAEAQATPPIVSRRREAMMLTIDSETLPPSSALLAHVAQAVAYLRLASERPFARKGNH